MGSLVSTRCGQSWTVWCSRCEKRRSFSLSLSRVLSARIPSFLYCSGLIIRSTSKFFPLVPYPCFIIGYARSSFFTWCHAIDQRLGGRGALPPGTWTLKGAFTGRTLLVSPRGSGRWLLSQASGHSSPTRRHLAH